MDQEDYLCHHGVKGMKWGVRKKRKDSSSSFISGRIGSRKTNQNKKSTSKVVKKKTSIKNLSDQELQAKVRRLQLEKQYRDLKRDEVSAGRKIVGEILKTSGKTLGVQVVNHVGGKAINKAFGAEVVNIGKKKKKDKAA